MRFIPVLLALIFTTQQLYAGVNLKNGNFYISYTDIMLKDEVWQDLKISRTYNSKSTDIGSFGFGWGFLFDTYLVLQPDFSILVKNHGAGGGALFDSELTNVQSIQAYVDLIIVAAYKAQEINNPEGEIQLRDNLLSSADSRLTFYKKYLSAGFIQAANFKENMTFFSKGCGCIGDNKPGFNYIVSVEKGYNYFDYKSNRMFLFDQSGKMIGLKSLENENWSWTISYNLNKQIEKISSYNGGGLFFEMDSLDRIIEITSNRSDRAVTFIYNGLELTHSKDSHGNYYRFEYDKLHNMTKVVYNPIRLKGVPEDAKKMEYSSSTSFITKITNRDGSYVTYNYPEVSNDEYGTEVVEYSENDNVVSFTIEWFFIKTNDHGNRWTYKTMTVLNSDTSIRIFHEISRKPIKVVLAGKTYVYNYDPMGVLLNVHESAMGNLVLNYDEDKKMNALVFNDEKFDLNNEAGAYTKLTLPNGADIELPIADFNENNLAKYKVQLKSIKKILDLGYYKIL